MTTPAFQFGQVCAALYDDLLQFWREVQLGMTVHRRHKAAALLADTQAAERRKRLAAFETSNPEARLVEMTARHQAEAAAIRRRHRIGVDR